MTHAKLMTSSLPKLPLEFPHVWGRGPVMRQFRSKASSRKEGNAPSAAQLSGRVPCTHAIFFNTCYIYNASSHPTGNASFNHSFMSAISGGLSAPCLRYRQVVRFPVGRVQSQMSGERSKSFNLRSCMSVPRHTHPSIPCN